MYHDTAIDTFWGDFSHHQTPQHSVKFSPKFAGTHKISNNSAKRFPGRTGTLVTQSKVWTLHTILINHTNYIKLATKNSNLDLYMNIKTKRVKDEYCQSRFFWYLSFEYVNIQSKLRYFFVSTHPISANSYCKILTECWLILWAMSETTDQL